MGRIVYTTIEYYPKSFNDESINVAFVFHNVEKGEIKFQVINNKKRLKSFDDEIDIIDFNYIMKNFEIFIKEPFQITIFNNNLNEICFNEYYIESIQNMFLNEFRFGKIHHMDSVNPEQDYNDFVKISLYYDLDKKERPQKDEIERIIKNRIKQKLKENSVLFYESSVIENVSYGEPIKVDFYYNNKCIKFLDTKLDSFTTKINTAKVWYFNTLELRKNDIDTIFIILNQTSTPEERAYIDILKEANPSIYYYNDIEEIIRMIR